MKLKKYIAILLGTILTGFAISGFYTPNKIVSGGVSGISTILYHTLSIPTGISFAVINITLLALSLKVLGFKFVRDTIVGSMLVSLFVQLFSYVPPVTENVVLAAVFGAVCYGLGIGLTLIGGASTGGTDIISRLFQVPFPHIKVGTLLMVIDSVVIGISLIVFKDIDLMLFGIAALFVATLSINILIAKLNISKLAFVVTDKGEEVSRVLVSQSPRGVTLIESKGAYTMESNQVLMCALKESEIPQFQKTILNIDEKAFIIFSESQQIIGNGFRVYK